MDHIFSPVLERWERWPNLINLTTLHDQFGNTWRLTDEGKIERATAKKTTDWQEIAGPVDKNERAWQTLFADPEGLIWVSDGQQWFRHNPRQANTGWLEAIPAEETQDGPWRLAAPLPCGNHDIFATEQDGTLYIAGGLTHYRGYPPRNHVFDELYAYDIAADTWRTVSRMPHPRCYNGIATLEDRIWIVGGSANLREPENPDGPRDPLNTVVIYNPVSAQWADGPPLHTARIEPIVATVAGRMYAAGGGDLDGELLDSVESIGPGESAWQMEPSLPVPMRQFAGCVLNDCLYICGKAGAFAYDPNKKTWDQLPAMPTDPPQAPLVAAHKEAMWVIGGYKTDAVWRYHPQEKKWVEAPRLPTAQSWGAAWSLQGQLMAIGGAHWSEALEVFIFDDRVFILEET